MRKLNEQIKFFILKKNYAAQVIFSGSDVPGEGEHKILDYIRSMKEPNGTYMIYGADADLIMLGLSTQLRYMCILREFMKFAHEVPTAAQRTMYQPQFQVINLSMVREYMDLEYQTVKMKIAYDIDRIIDDFILLCFFIGNDFLPRVFCFDIRQGTLEALITLFKNNLQECDDYLTKRGQINWTQFTVFMKKLSEFEVLALESRVHEME